MFILGLCLNLMIALSGAFPAESFNFYSSGLQSNYLYDDFDGYNSGTIAYQYHVPTNPYFVYDVSEGRWIPKCNSYYAVHDRVPLNIPQIIPVTANHRQRANRRQGSLRSGHSAMFDAFRGAIAFG